MMKLVANMIDLSFLNVVARLKKLEPLIGLIKEIRIIKILVVICLTSLKHMQEWTGGRFLLEHWNLEVNGEN